MDTAVLRHPHYTSSEMITVPWVRPELDSAGSWPAIPVTRHVETARMPVAEPVLEPMPAPVAPSGLSMGFAAGAIGFFVGVVGWVLAMR